MKHYAVCFDFGHGLNACVMSFENEARANQILGTDSRKARRVGYVGDCTFDEAVTRAALMERNDNRAWGPTANL